MKLAIGLASLFTLGLITPVAAFQPNSQTNEMSDWKGPEHPVVAGQKAMADTKTALEASIRANPAGDQAAGVAAAALTPQYLVGTWERRQTTYYYCGPTAIQVMSDYVWNTGAGKVKFTQKHISDTWTHTGTAGTGASAELKGANGVLVGSPRSSWPYWSYNPTSGADWYDKLETDLILAMPQIMNLQPWWFSKAQGYWYFLTDWADHQSTGGHWIVANGSRGAWDGTSGPQIRFDDGSGDYGGGTGTYWDVQYDMWQLIHNHHNVVIW